MHVPLTIRASLLAALCGVACVSALVLKRKYLPSGETLPGLRVDGVVVDKGVDVRKLVSERARKLTGRNVRLTLEDHPERTLYESTLGDLGVSVDEEATVKNALRIGHEADIAGRADTAARAKRGEIDVPLVLKIDDAPAIAILERLKEAEDAQPVSARLDLDRHTIIPEKPGRYLDAWGALAAIESAARLPDAESAAVPVASVPPRVTSSVVSTLDVHAVLSEYETYFSRAGDQQRRGKNIDMAAAKLDGLVLSPGELVSFNQIVGERSEENGFQKSWEIFKGEMVEGVGGGTCQVASTFHAAIFFAGLEIVERLPHSRPSAYIPMGLDSTVVYPIVDLKVRNPHPFPIVVHAKTEGNKLKMELLGPSRPVRVAFGRELLKTVPYTRKVVEKPELTGNKVLHKQHGIRGFKIKRKRLFTYPDGTTKKEENTDFYPPTTEIYEVPIDFDESRLPPLPEDPDAAGDDAPATRDATPAPAPAPAPAPVAAVPCTGDCTAPQQAQAATDLQLSDAPGAHAPTTSQQNPAKTMWLRR
jgi:vancomycin resistance protein YoaR